MKMEELTKETEIHRANRFVELFYRTFAVFTSVYILMHWLEAIRHVSWLGWLGAIRWEVPGECLEVYTALLTAYVTSKEITRWCHVKRTTRRGGRWVAAWLLSYLAIALLSMLFASVSLPHQMKEHCIIVLAAFFGSETFKKIYIRRMKNNKT